ncbi:MAG: D-aminoacyl-tRNA deacylase, partial [Methanomassiliicoccaceae archaeon]|nr:D-aminoacyl-tRNA deacylase [Methanomassiliicoccaceae archaeon]
EVVFMSRHSAASGEASLTVHPIGNFHENRFGGRERTLVRSNPALMTDALRRIARYNDMENFRVCFEVTHHGPWLDKPTFFIEIGSDERNWGNERAADILSDVILDMGPNDYDTAVGVGGGHYAPRFTEVALGFGINFGHMLPNYQMEGAGDDDILRMVKEACEASETKLVYMHRKSLKGPEERRISELIRSAGFELITSSDLEPISES